MSLDQPSLLRLSQQLAEALQELIAPLHDEIAQLRAALERVTAAGVTTSHHSAATVPGPERAARTVTEAPRKRSMRGATQDLACLVPRCEAAVLAKHLCETHYRIMRRMTAAGEKFDPKAQSPSSARTGTKGCEESGCNEPHYAKGLCRRHYMATRARERNAPRQAARTARATGTLATSSPTTRTAEPRSSGREVAAEVDSEPEVVYTYAGQNVVAMPTAEAVARVVAQYRGGLSKVADVLGRNRRNLMELLEKLDLMEQVVSIRASERKRILAAPLRERLADLLFKEKLLEDLGCLQEVDDAARRDVQSRCAQLAKSAEKEEDVLQQLGTELGLEEGGLKRLVWRYDLRRQLRNLKPRTPPVARSRP
jgi:hypothetical protein